MKFVVNTLAKVNIKVNNLVETLKYYMYIDIFTYEIDLQNFVIASDFGELHRRQEKLFAFSVQILFRL
jgi:hypothetical protein